MLIRGFGLEICVGLQESQFSGSRYLCWCLCVCWLIWAGLLCPVVLLRFEQFEVNDRGGLEVFYGCGFLWLMLF